MEKGLRLSKGFEAACDEVAVGDACVAGAADVVDARSKRITSCPTRDVFNCQRKIEMSVWILSFQARVYGKEMDEP